MPGGKLLPDGGEALKADLELIGALRDLAGSWIKAASHNPDLPSLEAIFDKAAGDLESAEAKAVFARLDAETVRQRLAGLVKAADGLSGRLPEDYRKLLTSLSKFGADGAAQDRGLVNWTLLDKDKPVLAGGDLNLSMKGSAALTLEAGDVWPEEADQMPSPLLRMAADVGIEAKARAKAPFQAGSAALAAEAGAQLSLNYFWNAPATSLPFVLAVAERLPNLPDPYDFDAVWSTFKRTDLAGIIYKLDGVAGFEVKVSLADSITLAKDVDAALGATVNVAVKLKGAQTVTLRRDPENGTSLIATLSRSTSRHFKGGLSVDAEVDLSALADRLHDVLQQAMEVWHEELATLRKFLSPGAWLQETGSSLIGDAATALLSGDGNKALREAIVRDLRGAIGVDTGDDAALGAWLKGELSGALSSPGLLKTAEAQADRVVDRLAERLPAFAQAEFREQLKGAVGAAVQAVERAFQAELDALLKPGQAAIERLGGLLRIVGQRADQAFTSVDQVFAGLRDLVDRYDKLFRKLLAETEDAARRKVSGRIQFEELRMSEDQDGLFFRLTADGANARTAFRALTRGEIDEILDLADQPSIGGFEFVAERSTFRRFRKSESKVSYDLVLLGFGLSGKALLSGDADVIGDGAGNIHVESNAVVQREHVGPRENREVRLVETYALRLIRGLKDAPPSVKRTLELGVNITHRDQSLKRVEIEGFISQLEVAGLVPKGTIQRGKDQFDLWKSDGRLVADMAAKLWLSDKAPLSLIRLGQRHNGQLTDVARREVIGAGLRGLIDAKVVTGEDLADAANLIDPYLEERSPRRTVPEVFIDFPEKLADRNNWSMAAGLDIDWPSWKPGYQRKVELSELFETQFRRLDALLQLIDTMGDIYEATPQDPHTGLPAGGYSAADYRTAQKAIASASSAWLKVNGKLFWIDEEVAPVTVALLSAMARLSGLSGQAPMSVTLTRRPDRGAPETVALA